MKQHQDRIKMKEKKFVITNLSSVDTAMKGIENIPVNVEKIQIIFKVDPRDIPNDNSRKSREKKQVLGMLVFSVGMLGTMIVFPVIPLVILQASIVTYVSTSGAVAVNSWCTDKEVRSYFEKPLEPERKIVSKLRDVFEKAPFLMEIRFSFPRIIKNIIFSEAIRSQNTFVATDDLISNQTYLKNSLDIIEKKCEARLKNRRQVKKNSIMLAQAYRTRNQFFSKLPREVIIKIISMTGYSKGRTINPETLAEHYFNHNLNVK